MRAMKAQASLRLCADSTESSLLDNAMRTKVSIACSITSTCNRCSCFYQNEHCGLSKNGLIEIHKMTEHARESVVLIAYASTESSYEPVSSRSLIRTLAAST